MKSLLLKIGVGVSVALNLFVFTLAMDGLYTREAIDESELIDRMK